MKCVNLKISNLIFSNVNFNRPIYRESFSQVLSKTPRVKGEVGTIELVGQKKENEVYK